MDKVSFPKPGHIWMHGTWGNYNNHMCTSFTKTFDHWFIVVVLCLPQKGQGAPGREPVFSEEEKKQMMLHAYRRQEELKVHMHMCTC